MGDTSDDKMRPLGPLVGERRAVLTFSADFLSFTLIETGVTVAAEPEVAEAELSCFLLYPEDEGAIMVAADPVLYELSASGSLSLSFETVNSRAEEDKGLPPFVLLALLLFRLFLLLLSIALLLLTPPLLAPFFPSILRSTLALSRVTEQVVVLMLPWWLEYEVKGAELFEILLVS